MNCPNCGLPNPDNAKFCSNCGTSFSAAPSGSYQGSSQSQAPPPTYQSPQSYLPPSTPGGGNSLGKNIGIGCLVLLIIFLFLGLSCTRACFRMGRGRAYTHARYY